MTTGLYEAFRDAGVDLLRAHRLDAYLRAVGDEAFADDFARTLRGQPADIEHLRATLVADLDGIVAGLALLDGMTRTRRSRSATPSDGAGGRGRQPATSSSNRPALPS